jgi:aspartyl-tRNA(Asn)/glutamyl-tRNA(Gln) amidotransferase subunit A
MINKSAVEMAEALSKGEITSVELTKAHLKQISEVDGQVHALERKCLP